MNGGSEHTGRTMLMCPALQSGLIEDGEHIHLRIKDTPGDALRPKDAPLLPLPKREDGHMQECSRLVSRKIFETVLDSWRSWNEGRQFRVKGLIDGGDDELLQLGCCDQENVNGFHTTYILGLS